MKILARKAARDLWMNRLRTFFIVAAIALSVALGIGMVNATENAFETFDSRFEATNYEDAAISFEPAVVDMEEIRALDGVNAAIPRLKVPAQAGIGGRTYEAHWVAAPFHDSPPYAEINGYQFLRGRYFSSPTAREVLVGNLFARENDVSTGDMITVFLGNAMVDLEVTGIVASPEYIYVISDGGWPQPSQLAPLFTTHEMALEALGLPDGLATEVLIRVDPGHSRTAARDAVVETLLQSDIRVTMAVLGTEEADYVFSRTDADAMGKLGYAFSVVILLTTAVVIYNVMTRLIASQRAHIGVMKSLGGRNRPIVAHYCLFGLFLGLAGALVGIPLGALISRGIMMEYARLIDLVDPVTTIHPLYVIIFASLGIAVSTFAALLSSMKATSVGPRDALSPVYATRSFSSARFTERILSVLPGRRRILNRSVIRNMSSHGLRTGVTVVALGASVVLVVACLGLAMGFLQPLEKNYEEYEKWDVQVRLGESVNASDVRSALEGSAARGLGEPMLDDFAVLKRDRGVEYVRVQAFESGSGLRTFNVIEGREDMRGGVLVGSVLARKLDISVGDELTFQFGNQTSTVAVVGTTGELMDDRILMTLDTAEETLFTGGGVNAIILEDGGMGRRELEETIRDTGLPVSSFAYTEDVINGMETMLETMLAMFGIFILFGIIAEVLFISTTVVLNTLEREREFISLRAMGASPGRIRYLVTGESLILTLAGLAVGLPLGGATTRWIMAYIVEDLMYYNIELGIEVYVITAAVAMLSAFLAAYISSSHVTRQGLADTIRRVGAA